MNTLVLLLREIAKHPCSSQRSLAAALDCSAGKINSLLKDATSKDYLEHLDGEYQLTATGRELLDGFKVDNAIILAAGFGSRFVPFTYETPKGLLEVNGVPMIERQIEQLLERNISEIIIVVGYLKEKFEYLIDKYGVKLVFNPEYAIKNNFVSVYYAREYLANSYILMADNWIINNIFNEHEACSWQSCLFFKEPCSEWRITVGAHDRIVKVDIGVENDWALVGPAFFTREFSEQFKVLLEDYYTRPGTEDYYWEHLLKENIKQLEFYPNRQSRDNVYEFESYEELREFDKSYRDATSNRCFKVITEALNVPMSELSAFEPLKVGMTNQSFLFKVNDETYVFRTPGFGTEKLIDRKNEKHTYELLEPLNLTDEVVYFDGDIGFRITKFYENARISDPNSDEDVRIGMQLLRKAHEASFQTDYRFDIAERMAYFEALARELDCIHFADFEDVRAKAQELLAMRDKLAVPEVLCHADFAHVNVLHLPNGEAKLIDWEYSGMADPLMDVAMYCIFGYHTREQIDSALRHYLGREPRRDEAARVYMYTALSGFLWSIWAEYKQGMGDEFGEYPMDMYRYMKKYYRLLKDEGYLI